MVTLFSVMPSLYPGRTLCVHGGTATRGDLVKLGLVVAFLFVALAVTFVVLVGELHQWLRAYHSVRRELAERAALEADAATPPASPDVPLEEHIANAEPPVED